MLKKLTLFLFLVVLSSSLFAQSSRYVMKANGELIKIDANSEVRTAIKDAKLTDLQGNQVKSYFPQPAITASGILDTLSYYNPVTADYTSRFGFNGQDVMMTWYQAPADLVIKAVGLKPAADDVVAGPTVSVRLLKLDWSVDELNVGAATYMGYYPSDGDGFNNISAFPEDASGAWVDSTGGDYPAPPWDNPDYDLWSDFGFGYPITPEGIADTDPAYQWVEMNDLGFEPEVAKGEIFAIAVTHDGTTLDGERIGFWSMDAAATGNWSWKFYENGRSGPDAPGWWAREFTFDFVAAVDLVGDRAPVIEELEVLPTSLSTGPFTVNAVITDDNPSGGDAGVASVTLSYTINGGAEQTVAMTGTEPNFSAELPAGTPGDEYTYWISEVTDVNGNSGLPSVSTTFSIYKADPAASLLVVVNGSPRVDLLVPYYIDLIGVVQEEYDLWNYGPVTAELLANYTSVVEIQMAESAPVDDNRDAYAAWAAEGNKNLLIAGQEQLGFLVSYTDMTFEPGDFEYDILGVENSYNDVSYDPVAQVGDADSSVFVPQAGSLLGDSLANALGSDTLLYYPDWNIGASNWVDQFDPIEGTDVFMMGYSYDGTERAVGHSLTLASGTKVAFMSYDPLQLVATKAQGHAWLATSTMAPFHQAMYWFGLNVVGVRNVDGVPRDFSLAQNYPNPFNPSTTIKYSLTQTSKVSLKVYDILGAEVATLINESQAPGVYEFDFNASNLASGMYIYTLRAGDFVSSKKMMLLK